ncbi:MAG: GspH/FimT family pseudopilin [Congregibacter sp.]|nr:GspH/FimT family pseudopilin [Congregibacter sp.]
MPGVAKSDVGFTLVELLITLAVTAILITLGTPALSQLKEKVQSARVIQHTMTLLNYARFEAVTRGTNITLCATDELGQCKRDWNDAVSTRVFVDRNQNRNYDSHETTLRTSTLPTNNGIVTWRASLGRRYVTFDASGFTWQNGTLIYCPGDGNARNAYAVVVNQAGRSYMTRDRDNDGIREDRAGNPLEC